MENTKKEFNFIAWFRKMWTEHPLFSTACALLLMAVLQIIALGFDQASFGDWLSRYIRNWINILRNNATIGIIALGMTFVIITGGIDCHFLIVYTGDTNSRSSPWRRNSYRNIDEPGLKSCKPVSVARGIDSANRLL